MWDELLINIVEIILTAIVSVGVPYLLYLIRKKVKNDELSKVLFEVETIIMNCVTMVNQTFVNDLKAQGKFDIESQKIAFEKCETAIMEMLSESTKKIVESFAGNLSSYLKNKIEAEVKNQKNLIL